jgi:hypothetical protein
MRPNERYEAAKRRREKEEEEEEDNDEVPQPEKGAKRQDFSTCALS